MFASPSAPPTVPWTRPPPWAGKRQEGAWKLPDEWPLAFEDAAPWLGAALVQQPGRWSKVSCPSVLTEHPEAAHAWAVIGEFWRLEEALRRSGAAGATVEIRSVPLLQSDYTWALQLHGVSPEGLSALEHPRTFGWMARPWRPKMRKRGGAVTLPVAFPQEWLGLGTRWLEKTFAGGLQECTGGYAIEVDASESLADRLERWQGPSYRSRWMHRQLGGALTEAACAAPRRPRM